jgi:hypothetical protein
VLADIGGILKGDRMKECYLLWVQAVIDLEETKPICVPAKTAWNLRWVFTGSEGTGWNIGSIDTEAFELFWFYEAKRIFLPKNFFRGAIDGDHLNTMLK